MGAMSATDGAAASRRSGSRRAEGIARLARAVRGPAAEAAMLLGAVGLGVVFHDAVDLRGGTHAAVDLALGLALCATLPWRRRFPIALALAALPVGLVSATAGAPTLVLLFNLGVQRPVRPTASITAAHIAVMPLSMLVHPDPATSFVMGALINLVLLGGVAAWGMFIRARRDLIASLRGRAERAEAEQSLRAERARLAERERIAREMHDVLAHRLSLLSLHAGVLEYRTDAPPADAARAARVIRENAHTALEELRAVIGALRDDAAPARPEPPQPTLVDLPRLVRESDDAGSPVRLDCELDAPAEVPGPIGRHAYRIVQEGLTNARKHAPGCPVSVVVSGAAAGGLHVEVRNPYPPAAADLGIPGGGRGIPGLRERVALAGGRLEHGRHGDEHRLRAWMPWPT